MKLSRRGKITAWEMAGSMKKREPDHSYSSSSTKLKSMSRNNDEPLNGSNPAPVMLKQWVSLIDLSVFTASVQTKTAPISPSVSLPRRSAEMSIKSRASMLTLSSG